MPPIPTSTQSTVEQLLELAQPRVDSAEVYYVASQDTPISFENNRLKSLETKALRGVALRVIHNGRLGFASSTDLTRLNDLVDAAIDTAQIGSPAEFEFAANFHDNQPASNYTPPSSEVLVETGQRLIQQVHEYNPDILVDVSFHVRSGQVQMATTQDVYAERSSQSISGVIGGNLVRGEDFLQIYTYGVECDRTPDFDQLLKTLLQKYEWCDRSKAKITSGSFPVIFTPRAAAQVLGGLFDTILSGQTVIQNASPLSDKVGEKVFDERLTLFEDPSIGPSACTFDDEGTPTSYTKYIDQGTVQGFYWDRRWGARANRASTGNGFRGGLSRPSPSMANLCLAPGQTSMADLIADMKEGLIVDQVLGAGQSNQLAGEFSVNLDLGYKVENGEIVGRVKDTMVAGSIFEAFQQLEDMGSEPEWVGGSMYLPCVAFKQLGVSARQA